MSESSEVGVVYITLRHRELADLAEWCGSAASKDTLTPALAGVRVSWGGEAVGRTISHRTLESEVPVGNVSFAATDRYRMHVAHAEARIWPSHDSGSVTLSAPHLQAAVKALPRLTVRQGLGSEVRLAITPATEGVGHVGHTTLLGPDSPYTGQATSRTHIPHVDADFPAIGALIPTVGKDDLSTGRASFGLRHLYPVMVSARKVTDKDGDRINFGTNGHKAARYALEPRDKGTVRAYGIIMPMSSNR